MFPENGYDTGVGHGIKAQQQVGSSESVNSRMFRRWHVYKSLFSLNPIPGIFMVMVCLSLSTSIARHLQKHQRLVSVIESMDNGKPIRETRDADIPTLIRHVYHHAGWAELADTEMANWKSIGMYKDVLMALSED